MYSNFLDGQAKINSVDPELDRSDQGLNYLPFQLHPSGVLLYYRANLLQF